LADIEKINTKNRNIRNNKEVENPLNEILAGQIQTKARKRTLRKNKIAN
jgi:hypothetical protein